MGNNKDFNDFPTITRTGLVVRSKQPFLDWLKSHDPDLKNYIEDDTDIYLLPEFDETSEIEDWLQMNFDTIFMHQMNEWYMDDSYWVENRDFKMFKEWFDYSLHTMIFDTVNFPINKW